MSQGTSGRALPAPPEPCRDRVLAAIMWRQASLWTEEEVRQYLRRRIGNEEDGVRVPFVDPMCDDITHYKRCGRNALYEFRCLLKSRHMGGPSAPFWVPYLDVRALKDADAQLFSKGWVMRDYFSLYSDGEEVWDSDGDSHDEDLAERRRNRGRPHELVKAQRRSRRAK